MISDRQVVTAAATVEEAHDPVSPPLLPGERTPRRVCGFVAVNALTMSGVLLAGFALLAALRGDVEAAAAAMLLVATGDGLDGALARRFGVASPFGGLLDTLADMSTFGVICPLVVVVAVSGLGPTPWGLLLGAGAVALAAAVRLARFTISPRHGTLFTGLPTTASAGVLAVALLALPRLGVVQAGLLMGVLAALLVSTLPYPNLAGLAKAAPWIWPVLLPSPTLGLHGTAVLVAGVYLASGPLWWAKRRYF